MGSQYTHRKWKSLLLIVCFRESVVDSKICKNRSQKLANVTVLERLSKNIFDANFTKYLQNHRWWGFILLTLFWWTYFSVVFVWKLSQHFKKFVFQNTILRLSLKEDERYNSCSNQQWKQEFHAPNIFKVKNEDTRTTSTDVALWWFFKRLLTQKKESISGTCRYKTSLNLL